MRKYILWLSQDWQFTPWYTDNTERTELFRLLTEETVLSVYSVHKESLFSSFLEKTMKYI